eukprot:9792629-Karenia_brevis.AAC.1
MELYIPRELRSWESDMIRSPGFENVESRTRETNTASSKVKANIMDAACQNRTPAAKELQTA